MDASAVVEKTFQFHFSYGKILVVKHFVWSLLIGLIGLIAGAAVGYFEVGTISAVLTSGFLIFVLSALEISLSFDNAVVNASALRHMNRRWQRRFMTWGILIAVFGMRLIFPLLVVSAIAWISPWAALDLAIAHPDHYARIMVTSHTTLVGFGASFLLLVALNYFVDCNKEIHWVKWLERGLAKADKIFAIEIFATAALFWAVARFIPDGRTFLFAAAAGMGTFVALHALMSYLHLGGNRVPTAASGLSLFLYLEVLDASFSLDGVVGAFAITNNLLLIVIGLGVGAMFVRSLTLYLVEKKTLEEFAFLEHGAFYAIAALAFIMLINLFIAVPEAITGLIGVAIIGLSLLSSLRHKWRRQNEPRNLR
jgi:uncharacterized protein